MQKLSPYLRLMRLHQPVGIWLLFWPCAWAILMASPEIPVAMLLLFLCGAMVMRSAGCIINDLWDRDIDRQVTRTKTRPLASGELTTKQAVTLLLVLLLIALGILVQLPLLVWGLAVVALLLVATYPLMKRITWWPQAFLGLTFNVGALMGWAAITETITLPSVVLYTAGMFWTLGYDTIYAYQDRTDDARVGVKSSALRLGENGHVVIAVFYVLSALFLMLAGILSTQSDGFLIGVGVFAFHLLWQVISLDIRDSERCMRVFRSNQVAGAIPAAALLLERVF